MKSAAILFLVISLSFSSRSQVQDQAQPNYSQDIMSRHLESGYSLYQSFTAGITGTLVQLDMGFVGGIIGTTNGTGRLRIYTGTDTTGVLLSATTVSVVCPNGPCTMNFMVNVPVISGQSYAFRFIPGVGIPDPYYLQGENPGTYAGGCMGYINPYVMGRGQLDLMFRTFVVQDPTGISEKTETTVRFTVFPNPAKDNMIINCENVNIGITEVSITDVLGKIVKQNSVASANTNIEISDLENGVYFVVLKNSRMTSVAQKIIIH